MKQERRKRRPRMSKRERGRGRVGGRRGVMSMSFLNDGIHVLIESAEQSSRK
jgi:hypothetical protein